MSSSSYTEIVKRASANGSFDNKPLEKIILDEEKQRGFQLSSNIYFVKVTTADEEELPITIKVQPIHRRNSEVEFRDSLFVNEVQFYSELLPFLSISDSKINNLFPKYYYGCATVGEDVSKDCVIIEDLSQKCFSVCKLGKDLDLEHITLILKALGRFHALSHKVKQCNPTRFNQLISKLKNDMEVMEDFIAAALNNAPNCYKGSKNNLEKLEKYCCNDPLKAYQESIIPKEPHAVLCHGDFCSNNLLFNYSDGKPVNIKLIDMQRCKYASPAIDLSFFLLYNTSLVNYCHWEFFLNTYYESMKNAYTNITVPSYKEFMEDFINHTIYGVSTCSYFFRVINMPQKELNEFLLLERFDKTLFMKNTTGEKAQKLINEMFQFLLDKQYIR